MDDLWLMVKVNLYYNKEVFIYFSCVYIVLGKSKKEAKQHAAKALLRIILKEFPELCSDPLFVSQIDVTSDLNDTFETMNFGDNDERNPIGMLQELCTSLHLPPPVYITECEDGLPHQRLFTVSCNVSDYKETGIGKSKKIAKRLAANNLYLMLKRYLTYIIHIVELCLI